MTLSPKESHFPARPVTPGGALQRTPVPDPVHHLRGVPTQDVLRPLLDGKVFTFYGEGHLLD